ncbi:endonuclease [Agarivorans sp. Toyoura001]|uniref:endonuclease n=1 Tax=unclassified Agarivorans TaxID=2636026 RepID=UPI0010DAD991|nr:endonuclease [Agarivorans sp. Toyoura001]GDY27994.1 hypothetical protein AHAT_38840 [Agarivorans sp. Toyoura001]
MRLKNTYAAMALCLLAVGCAKEHEYDNTMLVIEVMTDRAAGELSWALYDADANKIRQSQDYDNETYYEEVIALQPNSYRFVLTDTGNDGICCTHGAGRVTLKLDGEVIANVEEFDENGELFVDEYISRFDVANYSGHTATNLRSEYQAAEGLRGYELKTALHQISSSNHTIQSTSLINDFIAENDLDVYFDDKQGVDIVDIFSENPTGQDPYNYLPIVDVCESGSYPDEEGVCYSYARMFRTELLGSSNRYPMDRDIHHIFGVDSSIGSLHRTDSNNAKPFGFVSPYDSQWKGKNGTEYGYGHPERGNQNYFVFEPINEFKGDIARALLYLAIRYEDKVSNWIDVSNSNVSVSRILDGSNDKVFKTWQLRTLMEWHLNDPVSQKEQDRNDAAQRYQGNRNPLIDHPELVKLIWQVEGTTAWEAFE